LGQAAAHQGTAFVEIYQNCVIFNPDEWTELSDRRMRDERMLFLEDGQPMIFGSNDDKGIRLGQGFRPEIVELGNGVGVDDLLVHDASSEQLAYLLSRLEHPAPMGVVRRVERPTLTEALMGQVRAAQAKQGAGDLKTLYRAAELWEVKPHAEVEARVRGRIDRGLDESYVDDIDAELEGLTPADHMQDLLGQQAVCAVAQVKPIAVEPKSSVANAIRQMNAHNIGSVMVVEKDGQLAGILTEYDIMEKVACRLEDLVTARVEEYMTAKPVALPCDAPLTHALHLMSVHGIRHVPLVDSEGHPAGMISFRDVVRYLMEDVISS
jgi:CBS domain-containing protein